MIMVYLFSDVSDDENDYTETHYFYKDDNFYSVDLDKEYCVFNRNTRIWDTDKEFDFVLPDKLIIAQSDMYYLSDICEYYKDKLIFDKL